MARTEITRTDLRSAAVDLSTAGAAAELTDGNSFAWSADRVLYVDNGDAVDLTVTVQTPVTIGRQARPVDDYDVVVPAGTAALLPRLGPEYRQPDDGAVWVDYAGATGSVTVAVFDL
ncbi:hypothetical protein ACLIYP_05585 [Streptomyces nanhaiensis]|uniref:hypothetical protein n=1 Tax=Streptomyces nanhaiensis TaxID=679319 RepID=UPI00399D343B